MCGIKNERIVTFLKLFQNCYIQNKQELLDSSVITTNMSIYNNGRTFLVAFLCVESKSVF